MRCAQTSGTCRRARPPTPSCSARAHTAARDQSLGAPQATFLRLERAVAGEQTAPGQRGEKGEQRKALYGAPPLSQSCAACTGTCYGQHFLSPHTACAGLGAACLGAWHDCLQPVSALCLTGQSSGLARCAWRELSKRMSRQGCSTCPRARQLPVLGSACSTGRLLLHADDPTPFQEHTDRRSHTCSCNISRTAQQARSGSQRPRPPSMQRAARSAGRAHPLPGGHAGDDLGLPGHGAPAGRRAAAAARARGAPPPAGRAAGRRGRRALPAARAALARRGEVPVRRRARALRPRSAPSQPKRAHADVELQARLPSSCSQSQASPSARCRLDTPFDLL
jgi:hypothetical protein